MSLVGSLGDLGLGDILQIVSLSRKSGLLMIHSEEGEGRIVFCDGLVRAAFVKGEANDLRDLLLTTGFVADAEFAKASELAAARGVPLDEIIPECTGLTKERLDSLRREHIERSVFRIFSWQGGEFSFEVRDQVDPRDSEILLSTGINAQYLTMEATRMDDEGERSETDDIHDPDNESFEIGQVDKAWDEEAFFSGEAVDDPIAAPISGHISESFSDPFSAATSAPIADLTANQVELEPDATGRDCEPPAAHTADTVEETHEIPGSQPLRAGAETFEIVALSAARRVGKNDPPFSTDAGSREHAEVARAGRRRPVCLIAIDPELAAIEWQKANLADLFQRVHIFQSSEAGIARIRQYLGRGDVPVALVSSEISQDPALGSSEVGEFVRRLKQQAPNMPVLVSWVEGEKEISVPLADAMIRRPNPAFIGGRRSGKILEAAVVNLRADMCEWLDGVPPAMRQSSAPVHPAPPISRMSPEEPASGLQRLRETSQRMRDPDTRGEVLSLVLDFAAESFARVAIFMVRDETAVGIAQRGLPAAGGPDDDEFCGLEIPAADVEWFARVIEGRSAIAQAPLGDGDWALSLRLGDRSPTQAYIAPIESGGRVVALLYADNLPAGGPIPDTTILQIVLHEAGLALERALLERALARVENDTSS